MKIAGWKIFRILVVVVISGILAILLFLMTPPGNYLIMKIAQHQLTRWLEAPIAMESLRTNLFTQIQINNFALHDSSDSQPPILTFARLKIRYNLFQLFAARLSIHELLIDRPKLMIVRDAGGRFHLPTRLLATDRDATSPTPTDRTGFQFELQKLTIQNLELAFHDIADSVTIQLSGVNGSVHASNSSDHLAGSLTAKGGSIWWKNLQQNLHQLNLSFQLQNNDLTLTDFHLATDDLVAQVSGTYSLAEDRLANTRLAIDLQLRALNQLTATTQDSASAGNLAIRASLAGPLDRPAGILTAQLLRGRIQHVPIDIFRATFALAERRLQLDSLLLAAWSAKLVGAGEILIKDSALEYQLRLALKDLQIQKLLQYIYDQDSTSLSGTITGTLSLNGRNLDWQQLRAAAELSLSQLSLDDQPVEKMQADLRLDRGELQFHLYQNGSAIRLVGNIQDSLIAGRVAGQLASITAIANLVNVPQATGKLSFAGQFAGTINSPEALLNFQLQEGSYFGVPIDSLKGGLYLQNQELSLSNLTGQGYLHDFRQLARYLKIDSLAGTGSYYITAHGALDELQATIGICWTSGQIATIRFDSLKCELKTQGPQLVIEQFDLKQPQQLLQLSGHIDWQERLATELAVAAFELDSAQKIIASQGRLDLHASFDEQSINGSLRTDGLALQPVIRLFHLPTDIRGLLKTELAFRGNLSAPKLYGNLEVIDGVLNSTTGSTIDSLKLKLQFQDQRIEIQQLAGKIGSVGFTGAGAAEIEDVKNFTVTLSCRAPQLGAMQFASTVRAGEILAGQLRLDRLDLSKLALISPTHARLNGWLNLEIALAGRIEAPEMAIKLTSDQISIEQTTIDSLHIFGRYDQQVISFQESGFKIGTGRIYLAGTLPIQLATDDQLPVGLDSLRLVTSADNLDISWLKPLLPSLATLSGKASFNLTMMGSLRQPKLNGTLRLQQMSLSLPTIAPAISNLNAELQCQDNQIRIHHFAGEMGSGTFYLSGGLTIDELELTNANLSLLLNQINLRSSNIFVLGIERGELHLTQANQQFRLAGQVRLAETKYIQDFRPRVRDFLTHVPNRSAAYRNQFFNQLALDVIIQGQENVWIENNLAKIQLSANLNLAGTLNQPNIAGRILVHKGYVLYLDRKFKIIQGVMDFNDPHRINPLIQLTAICSITDYQTAVERRYEITLKLSGTLDKPSFELSASPPLDNADIVALLTVGRTRRDLFPTAVNGPRESLQDVMFSRFKEITSQRLAGMTEQKLSETLALENVSIEGNLFQIDKSWGPRLTATKQLSDRINITYSTVIGQTNDQQIRLGYQLYRFISVVGNTGQRGQSGLDLKFNFKFY
ncbi:MAG: translocation/assembly module TamB domain-containing protein [candidate division KSB1 bacterium]|nr:translocation/assembly module TamB domain-containing protein [candidate division KSB1 bacterium]MDZ7318060.1 translocation/assembly module TamB domain-containing protein [candidate division KSB1 bacterium]MDZ7339753.1 translocation/assembly module TamB domain-containing protein [candidate division KSB1 bacterium]